MNVYTRVEPFSAILVGLDMDPKLKRQIQTVDKKANIFVRQLPLFRALFVHEILGTLEF